MALPQSSTEALEGGHKIQLEDLFGILGVDTIHDIATAFYDGVYADDEEPWFRDLFDGRSDKELSIFSQETFFVQRFGGDPMYGGMEKDDDFVEHVHRTVKMTPRGLRRWMQHMRKALLKAIPDQKFKDAPAIRSLLMDWFWDFGAHMLNSPDDASTQTPAKAPAEATE
mmetsp:Transcript_5343/g.15065  ORF Transcript_5343/g.15065 Transcript_5343/m.15065 type:complete len:169 (+) Transcript_5343:103-609(+)|eukprot:CAMPEP_0119126274 /NCGR_PEP_ID=MMETSP1310-20130426/5265_1 /TAXON_ID=464262 /ORGANISM="Genus nov. species nov., Strain RCC2339" /LENGTH=168 /DNA_ID=CAMNT_0007116427 /DNA_START=41 /DNA_END=547 /DNA_ORIENTATION=-